MGIPRHVRSCPCLTLGQTTGCAGQLFVAVARTPGTINSEEERLLLARGFRDSGTVSQPTALGLRTDSMGKGMGRNAAQCMAEEAGTEHSLLVPTSPNWVPSPSSPAAGQPTH